MTELTVLSLYSGAGGMDLGFTRVGLRTVWANEIDAYAAATYAANLGDHIVCGDVLSTPIPDIKVDVIIGGPPCQGFSVIGHMDPDDVRSLHVDHFLDVVERLRPRAFVMENVKALAVSPRWQDVRDGLLVRARELGYHTDLYVLDAADYEVPQSRERMFLCGGLDGLPRRPKPASTSRVTVRETLKRLPLVGEQGNHTLCTARVVPAKAPVMRPTAHKGSLLFNGSGRPLDLDAPAKTLPASMGGNATPIIDQDELEHGADPWVVGYHDHLLAGGEPYTSAPSRMRRLTVQEAAALQTFPSDWIWSGPQSSCYRQIGNAVPPRLAMAVAEAVKQSLVVYA